MWAVQGDERRPPDSGARGPRAGRRGLHWRRGCGARPQRRDADRLACADRYTDADGLAATTPDRLTVARAHCCANCNRQALADRDPRVDTRSHPLTDADSDADADSNADRHSRALAHTNRFTDTHGDANARRPNRANDHSHRYAFNQDRDPWRLAG